ncbi:TPA_asm: penton [Stylophora coral adintovirus]|nr:TPA_asm: penton [Stylophora coral adintovirus]
MTETPIFLSSLICTKGVSHDFATCFNPVMRFDQNTDYLVALDSLSMSYSWYNVSSSYNNNKLKYSHDSGTTWTEIELPNGNFSYSQLNAYVQRYLESAKHSKTGIEIKFVPALFKVLIGLEDGYQVDLRTGDFADLIGFTKKVVTATSYGDKLPDITRSADDIYIHTNIISESVVGGKHADVIYTFSVDNLPLSYPFHIELRHKLYNKINTSQIVHLRIYITDALNRPVDLNGVAVSLKLLIKEKTRAR